MYRCHAPFDLTFFCSFQGSVNPDQLYKIEVFQGRFLDPKSVTVLKCVISSDIPDRSTVMFGVFLGFGTMIFAIARAYSPTLIFFSIFGTIAIDIFCVRVYILFPSINTQLLFS